MMTKSMTRILSMFVLLTQSCISFAGVNPITVTFVGGTTSFAVSGTGTAYYAVAVSSSVSPHNIPLALSLIGTGTTGELTATQQTSGTSPCTGINGLCTGRYGLFLLSAGQSCCLAFSLRSGNAGNYSIQPTISSAPQAYSVQATAPVSIAVSTTPPTATLTVNPSTLALSVPGLTTTTGPDTSGTPRVFTITNTSSVTATGVACPISESISIASISCEGCGTISGDGGVCTVTITPSSFPSAAIADTNPTPITLTIQGTNTNTLNPTLNILTYGSFYQSGFLYSIIETADTSQSIGGTVIAENDAIAYGTGIVWDSSSDCTSFPYTCATTNADSGVNGSNLSTPSPGGNTYLITSTLTPPTAEASYAAGLCATAPAVNGYGNWYLPAICQVGYDGSDSPYFNCGTSESPYIPNIQKNLLDPGTHTFNYTLPGSYWSSTEYEQTPGSLAWFQHATSGTGSSQVTGPKTTASGVRCSRDLTV